MGRFAAHTASQRHTHVRVNHLNRCKTSTWWCQLPLPCLVLGPPHKLLFLFNLTVIAGGSGRSLGTATNEDAHLIWWYRLGRQSAYLHPFSFLVNGDRLSQEPACRFFKQFQTKLKLSDFHLMLLQFIASSNGYGDGNFSILSQVFSPTHSCQV